MTFVLFSRVLTGVPALAQAPPPAFRPDPGLIAYFSGTWTGEGSFASGRPIKASLSFHLTLDSAWLVAEHQDLPPNLYKATTYWGTDVRTGEFIAYAFDNFQGHRQFVSNGFIGGRLVLASQQFQGAKTGVVYEHFIYERLTATQFKMSYEVSQDGIEWRMGDSLVFTKQPGS